MRTSEDYDRLEFEYLCLIFYVPELLNSTGTTLMFNDSYMALYEITKEIFGKTKEIPTSIMRLLIESSKTFIPEYVVDLLYNKLHSFKLATLTNTQAIGDMSSIETLLSLRVKKMNMQMEIECALMDLKEESYDKAVYALQQIESPFADKIISTAEMFNNCMEISPGIKCGIEAIDNSCGFLKGNMISLYGDSGSMKTRYTMWIMLQMLKYNPNMTCLFFEKEMPYQDIARTFMSYIIGKSTIQLIEESSAGVNFVDELEKIYEQHPHIKSLVSRFKIIPNDAFHNAYDISRIIRKEKPDIWALDYLMMLEHLPGDKDPTNEKVRNTLQVLKNTTASTYSLGIVISQINKTALSNKANKIPSCNDMEWGGFLKQVSAYIFGIFFPAMYDRTLEPPLDRAIFLLGEKNRNDKPYDLAFTAVPEYAKFNIPSIVDHEKYIALLEKIRIPRTYSGRT
jgi:replicative DNA helicase